ncbi:MAG: winged helix-turn-helix transcriptional regulator [Chitinophagaceae bacterium]|nr:winged helix-turn-helix transcriptional regulator [Anaerolineae bacterium]
MMNTRNPYTSMLLTFNPARVYGWENEISSILQVITAVEPNGHAIYGIRAIGKTTLLKYLKDKRGALLHYEDYIQSSYQPGGRGRLLFVYLNFRHFKGKSSVFDVMLAGLEDEILHEGLETPTSTPYSDATLSRQHVVNQLRDRLIDLDRYSVRVVFLLDDFDEPLLETIDDDDDRLLRTLCDDAALIIATESPISELRPDLGASSPLLGILRPEAIGLISESAARQLVTEPALDAGVTLSLEEATFLIHVAGRQPFLLTTACELYFDMRQEYPDLAAMIRKTDTRSRFQTQFVYQLCSLPHVDNLLQRLWSRLDSQEQRALYAMTQGGSGLPERGNIAARLANKALAYWDIKSGYKVFSLLFEDFVRRRFVVETEQSLEPTLSSASSNNIPPIDRALLKYFLKNPNRVLLFDELLDAVWEENQKSKRALEAAVHRLRRSLSENEQIMNIRGKGYKFVMEKTSISMT